MGQWCLAERGDQTIQFQISCLNSLIILCMVLLKEIRTVMHLGSSPLFWVYVSTFLYFNFVFNMFEPRHGAAHSRLLKWSRPLDSPWLEPFRMPSQERKFIWHVSKRWWTLDKSLTGPALSSYSYLFFNACWFLNSFKFEFIAHTRTQRLLHEVAHGLPLRFQLLRLQLEGVLGRRGSCLAVSINGGTPIAGWFIGSWKIPI